MIETKEQAFDLFEQHRQDWLTAARTFINSHDVGARLTVDDVRDAVPPPEGVDGRVMGAVFKGMPWEAVGYKSSKRLTCHKRPIAIFERTA